MTGTALFVLNVGPDCNCSGKFPALTVYFYNFGLGYKLNHSNFWKKGERQNAYF